MSETQTAAGPGHNSGEDAKTLPLAVEKLRSLVDRVERMNGEVRALITDRKEIFTEAKSAGFDTKVLRQLIALRARDAAKLDEDEVTLDNYKRALGM